MEEIEKTEVVPLDPDYETKTELTMLLIMEATKRDKRKAYAEFLGIPWSEYKRYVKKYRYVLRAYRKDNGTYKGEFENVEASADLTQQQIAEGHKLLDSIIKHIHSQKMGI